MQRQARLGVLLVFSIAVLAASESAWATHKPGHPGPCRVAAVCQYVEQIPTSSGSQATGFGKPRVTPLPPAVKEQLTRQAGADAPLLEQIATSSVYGAPQKKLRAAPVGPNNRSSGELGPPIEREDTSIGGALSAAVDVTADGSNGRLIGLLIVLLAITGVALASAGYRQRAVRETTRR